MQVLFLGGPWHGERHDVIPCRRARGAEVLPTEYSVQSGRGGGVDPVVESAARPSMADRVVYTRRFAQAGGERRPVYVAPDYYGPARA